MIRNEPLDHHPWCNFFDRIGACALCDRLEKFYPVTTEEDFSDLVEKYFPGLMDKWQELHNKDYDEPL